MKTTLQISLRQAATAILLSGCFLMNSQSMAPVSKTGENGNYMPEGAKVHSIGLLLFSAVNNEGQVNLTWVTRSETDNNFLVERSADGLTWEVMTLNVEVKPGDAEYYYNCVDPSPYTKEISYYRLKQTDLKGDYPYSDIVAVEMDTPAKVKLYPNPVVSYVQIISDSKTTRESTVSFYNTAGHLVKQITGNINTQLIDVTDLETGNYFAVIDSGTKVSRVQFVKN
jgi:hypothetical protein